MDRYCTEATRNYAEFMDYYISGSSYTREDLQNVTMDDLSAAIQIYKRSGISPLISSYIDRERLIKILKCSCPKDASDVICLECCPYYPRVRWASNNLPINEREVSNMLRTMSLASYTKTNTLDPINSDLYEFSRDDQPGDNWKIMELKDYEEF